ncbi:MAG TPA: cytochrome P450 [Xanthomonadales bacterium]|nr:cytochrome P450 [Xanthomonadales bacterium]
MDDASPTDLQSPDFIDDPYSFYRKLRDIGRPHWAGHVDRTGTKGIWLITRYQDVARVLRDTQDVSKDVSRLIPAGQVTAFDRMLLNLDPPEHTQLRAVIAPLFSVTQVARLEALIEGIVESLLREMETRAETDFVADFAVPLPIRVVADIIGVPREDMPLLKKWTDDLITGLDSGRDNDSERERVAASMRGMTRYLSDLVDSGIHPDGSLLDHVSEIRLKDGWPTTDDTLSLCLLMVLAGHETTVNLLGNGLLLLLQNPEQLEKLRNNPGLTRSAVDEMLRCESPLQRGTYRITQVPYKVGGVTLEVGQQISAVIGSANRDEHQFPDPDVFDIQRSPNNHLAFGKGIHKCLGEKLARAEARIAFTRLLERFPDIELLEPKPRWQEKTLFRGLKSLKVRMSA